MICFDIETKPLPLDQLTPLIPEFDESTVKYGNTKDPEKRAAKLKEVRQAHIDKFVDKAALDPVTSTALAIGFYDTDECQSWMEATAEVDLIQSFWRTASRCRDEKVRMIGLNIFEFDLPYLCQRSWILGIDVPGWARPNRYFDPVFVDLRERWMCGKRMECKSNFNWLATAFGTAGKPDGVTGKDFWKLHESDPEAARNYLLNDLFQPAKWATAMGIQ